MNDAVQTPADQFRLTMDYGQSLQQMIAAGRYDWTSPDITAEQFPTEGAGTVPVEATLFHFDRDISSEDVVEAIKTADAENPWEAAKIEHLLSFGATHPDEQRRYPIVALVSVERVHGIRSVPCLSRRGVGRHLNLLWRHDDWLDAFRFLAVRALSPDT